ncbi:MAG: AtpZ/AtpI family protein [Alphaproteobacteria bacterium]|nr:AtpZ/AtpI family protein [Alphaproteobacteria bacterium]
MSEEIEQLNSEIKALKRKTDKPAQIGSGMSGYNVSITILTDLLGCIFIGCAVGLFLQKCFDTSPLLTAGLTILGGVAGLYTTIRYAIREDKKVK